MFKAYCLSLESCLSFSSVTSSELLPEAIIFRSTSSSNYRIYPIDFGQVIRKFSFGYASPTELQISLRVCAGWSEVLLGPYRIWHHWVAHCRMKQSSYMCISENSLTQEPIFTISCLGPYDAIKVDMFPPYISQMYFWQRESRGI